MTKLFLDGGAYEETSKIDAALNAARGNGLDGQTTNPTLIAKAAQAKNGDKKISSEEAFAFYKQTVTEMSKVVSGPVSIQLILDPETARPDDLVVQARDRVKWIPNAMIKFPCTEAGIAAIEVFCEEGPVNVTLVFSQAQAAAVYAATKNAKFPVVISPFVGRLDDQGEDGMSLIANIMRMFKLSDHHVGTLTASVRNLDHLREAFRLESDIATVPGSVIEQWVSAGMPSGEGFTYPVGDKKTIPYQELDLSHSWRSFDIHHDLTDAGVTRFWSDWSSIVG